MLTPPATVIGSAKMRADGTILLELRNPWMQREIPPSHPEHAGVVAHVGGLSPGQEKPVPPWPDDIDDAAVERSLVAWAAGKGLRPEDCTANIDGTDQSGRIVVGVVCGPRRFSLRVRPGDYRVFEDGGG